MWRTQVDFFRFTASIYSAITLKCEYMFDSSTLKTAQFRGNFSDSFAVNVMNDSLESMNLVLAEGSDFSNFAKSSNDNSNAKRVLKQTTHSDDVSSARQFECFIKDDVAMPSVVNNV